MQKLIVTNNYLVFKNLNKKSHIIYDKKHSHEYILLHTRNLIHKGHKLLTHPLSSSIKPNETPIKSIVLTNEKMNIDIQSLNIIEQSINVFYKFQNIKKTPSYNESVLFDFKLIDFDIIKYTFEI